MDNLDLIIGTYGEHIYKYRFNTNTLEFSLLAAAKASNASYVIGNGDKGVFAVREEGANSGVYSFIDNSNSNLTISSYKDAPGSDPCFLELSLNGKFLFTADYSGGSVSVYPINHNIIGERANQLKFNGSGPVTRRQASSHIHQIRHLPSSYGIEGEWILATDLGADKIHLIKVNENDPINAIEAISDIDCPAGSGLRHMEFSKDGRLLYCITELSGEILVYEISSDNGVPQFFFKHSILADEFNSCGSGDMHIHPSGRWLYTSHRLINDRINVYKTEVGGELTLVCCAKVGNHPRNFMISKCGRFMFVACKNDKSIQVFKIGESGELISTNGRLEFQHDQPSSVVQVE